MRVFLLLILTLAAAPALAAAPGNAAPRTDAKPRTAATPPRTEAAGNPAPATGTAPRLEVLLNQKLATQAGMGQPVAALALTPNRLVLLADATRAYLVGWGGVKPLDNLRLDAFAYTRDGLLMGVRGRQLMYLGADGKLKTLAGLPATGMGLSAGLGPRLFLFERNAGGASALYELLPQRRFSKLLESPQAITAVVETPERLLFAAGNSVFALAPDKSVKAVAALPGGRRIVALAASGRTLYLSDGDSVFTVSDGKAALLLKDTGGALLHDGSALLVLDPERQLLLRVVAAR